MKKKIILFGSILIVLLFMQKVVLFVLDDAANDKKIRPSDIIMKELKIGQSRESVRSRLGTPDYICEYEELPGGSAGDYSAFSKDVYIFGDPSIRLSVKIFRYENDLLTQIAVGNETWTIPDSDPNCQKMTVTDE